jgi:hypothetical protein
MLGYMSEATNNVDKLVPDTENLVACVYCCDIYKTVTLTQYHNCLVCKECSVDAILVIVPGSQLYGITEPEQKTLLRLWHTEGFTPITK